MKVVTELSIVDSEIRRQRIELFDAVEGPREGDYVIFADGVERRISEVWLPEVDSIQTSDGGSWYLGKGYCSFSGSLFTGVPLGSLTLTDESRDGAVWFFHHDQARAHNGVHTSIPFRVYECSENAPR